MKRETISLQAREARLAFLMLAPTFAIVFIIVIFPVVWNVWLSLKPVTLGGLRGESLFEFNLTLRNFAKVLTDPEFKSGLALTLIYATAGSALSILLGLAAAFLVLSEFPGRTVLFMFIFPMRYRALVWLLVGLDLFYFMFGTGQTAHSAHLGGALFGYLHFRYAHKLDRYFAQMEVKAERDRERQESEMREEVDRLLEKIHQEGLGSLTEREKKFLKRSSRRFEKKT